MGREDKEYEVNVFNVEITETEGHGEIDIDV